MTNGDLRQQTDFNTQLAVLHMAVMALISAHPDKAALRAVMEGIAKTASDLLVEPTQASQLVQERFDFHWSGLMRKLG